MMSKKVRVLVAAISLLNITVLSSSAFAKPKNPFASKVCGDTSWCIQNKDCYETESNRRALVDWYVDNC
jgi:hypothetical protein